MSKFDSREEYENWKSRNALKRYGKAELERSDKEWAKKESGTEKKNGRGWLWGSIVVLMIILFVLYAYRTR